MTAKPARPASTVRRLALLLFILVALLLALALSITALGQSIGSFAIALPLVLLDQKLPFVFRLHMGSGGLALLAIAAALLLRRRPRWHRPAGRLAVALVMIAGTTALPSAWLSEATFWARAGLFAQGAVWLSLVAAGLIAILRRHRTLHAELMMAVAAVASGAIVLRLGLHAVAETELPFDRAYAVMTWMAWLAPLLGLLAWRHGRRLSRPAS